MTIDNDTRAIVTVSLADTLRMYSCDRDLGLEHLIVLAVAIKDAQAAFVRAAKKVDYDAMIGAATRLNNYAGKLNSFTDRLGSDGR